MFKLAFGTKVKVSIFQLSFSCLFLSAAQEAVHGFSFDKSLTILCFGILTFYTDYTDYYIVVSKFFFFFDRIMFATLEYYQVVKILIQ